MPKYPRKPDEKFKVKHNVFDEFTNRNLFKLISEGIIDGMVGPLSVGKESNVFTAKKGDGKVVVKIYRLETCDFNRMYDYIKFDPRFLGINQRRRDVIFAWARREFRNLMIARDAGVRVPTPLAFKFNILVLQFVGDEQAAPKLKDSPPEDLQEYLDEIIANMKRLYSAGLVHADLSPFNILNHNGKPVFIDFSQATPLQNPNAREYLERDAKNIANFFIKQIGRAHV